MKNRDSEDVQRIRKMYKGFAVSNGASCGNLDVRLFQHSSLTDGVYSVSHVMQSRLYVGLCQDFKGCGEPMLSSMIRILLKSSITCMRAKHRARDWRDLALNDGAGVCFLYPLYTSSPRASHLLLAPLALLVARNKYPFGAHSIGNVTRK